MAALTVTGTALPKTASASSIRSPSGGERFSVLIFRKNKSKRRILLASSASNNTTSSSSSPSGLYSAQKYELTAANVDMVLEDVRPYLISDGGNVEVVSVEDGVVSLRLQGACESCPSSTTTMKLGIERVLKEKFGDSIKQIQQLYDSDQPKETTIQAVNNHLEILRPAIKNYGGSVEVVSIEGGECHVKYVGPDSIASGIKAAIKEKFPDILNVTFLPWDSHH
ncbi:NifU-like protein 1, chloroplastic [Stylosanthes scabra]|uniref:NifU-like protein 1, chloroplastic n=1 Tax=Stylosanthes scabra TaxID=79078 RepID=A0ABU6V4K0_9FABA|nr:NifU-like protein 1, chloroplastic [Stylosanthes scabra]